MLKLILFLSFVSYLYYLVHTKGSYDSYLSIVRLVFSKYELLIIVPIILFAVNWAVEALKWQYLIRKIEAISFGEAFKGVLTGVAFGIITPMAIGDYVGRILQLENYERLRTVGAVFVSRIAQFYVTLVWGSIALLIVYLDNEYADNWWLTILFWSVPILNFLFGLLLIYHKRFMIYIENKEWLGKVYEWFEIISTYSILDLLYVILLSFFRYFVFASQFVMVLYLFGVSTNIQLLLVGVNFIFLVKSIIPSLFDLGVRESAAVYFFSLYGCNTDLILFASLSLWMINILMPALLGLIFIFRLKLSSFKS